MGFQIDLFKIKQGKEVICFASWNTCIIEKCILNLQSIRDTSRFLLLHYTELRVMTHWKYFHHHTASYQGGMLT